jgi:hypothetical protein
VVPLVVLPLVVPLVVVPPLPLVVPEVVSMLPLVVPPLPLVEPPVVGVLPLVVSEEAPVVEHEERAATAPNRRASPPVARDFFVWLIWEVIKCWAFIGASLSAFYGRCPSAGYYIILTYFMLPQRHVTPLIFDSISP